MNMNLYIGVALVTWVLAQWIKFSISAFKGDINFRYLYASGGMPSVHSAVVCALMVTVGLHDGWSSALFGITAVFSAIVMYDALGVRRSAGEQAVAINMLIETLEERRVSVRPPLANVREVLGHEPREVLAGAVLGVLVAAAAQASRLGNLTNWLAKVPVGTELAGFGVLFALVLAVTVVTALMTKRQRHHTPSYVLHIWSVMLAAVAGLFVTAAAYENVAGLGTRGVLLAVVLILLVAVPRTGSLMRALDTLSVEATTEADRKSRWLAKERRKRKKR